MKIEIQDTANDRVYKLQHVSVNQSWERGLYGQWYFDVRMSYMDDEGMMGEDHYVARFFFKSENTQLSEEGKDLTSLISKPEAFANAKMFAHQLAAEHGVGVKISSSIKFD
jgi:hypothetical protein